MIVVDASVLVSALVDRGRVGAACTARLASDDLAAPSLIDVEVLSAIRGLARAGRITEREGDRATESLRIFPIDRVTHTELIARAWALRHNVSAYDAVYLALAERLGASFVTGDAGLRHVPGASCTVEVIG